MLCTGRTGGKPYFSPRVPPCRPACCMEACGTQCGFFKLEALAPSPPAVGRLSARCHSAAPNILGAVAAPLCSDSLPRPLRARHRRASPRVLEKAQGCSTQLLRPVLLFSLRHSPHIALCPSSVQVRTSPYSLARTLCLAQSALPANSPPLCIAPAAGGDCGVAACNTARMVIYYFEADCG